MVLLFAASRLAWGQGWWAPGACWVYEEVSIGWYLDIYMYTGDTILDGLTAQESTHRICNLYFGPGGSVDTSCVSDIWHFRDYVSLQGDVVLYKDGWSLSAPWDTLYYLGVPGDRWWPPTTAPMTCGYFGMLEIQDTGHVVIGGENLRTWSLAYLDSAGTSTWGNGQTLGSDTLAIIERIGGLPRRFGVYGYDCYGPIDPAFFRLRHYSDGQIATGMDLGCDIVLRSAEYSNASHTTLLPNPGTDHFQLSGLGSSSAQVDVHDALGRICFSTGNYRSGERIGTETWAPGIYYVTVINTTQSRTLQWHKQ